MSLSINHNLMALNAARQLETHYAGLSQSVERLSSGALKVHFGSGNDSAEDYYCLTMEAATIRGLGLAGDDGGAGSSGGGTSIGNIKSLGTLLVNGAALMQFTSGIVSFAVIPAGTKNISIHMYDNGANDSIQLLTRNGTHLAGTTLTSASLSSEWSPNGIYTIHDIDDKMITEDNAFLSGATYDGSVLNGAGADVPYTPGTAGNYFSYHGMTIGYSGEGNISSALPGNNLNEYLTIDEVTEDLVLLVVGAGAFSIQASWDHMPAELGGGTAAPGQNGAADAGRAISIQTQQLAQEALENLDGAIIRKDTIRSLLGAMQNRLENTISNLRIQAENLQAAESRISDVEVAEEMTGFVRSQILTQTSVAMLAQANSLPQMALTLIQG